MGPKSSTPEPNEWRWTDLPETPYRQVWELQGRLAAARKDGVIDTDVVIFVEHPPVFTLGRRGGLENLIVSRTFLDRSGIPLVQVERGGNITFHGPGQLVAYPIVDLQAAGLKVVDYVQGLEEVMIRTAAHWGVAAVRDPRNRGVWIGDNKLGSVGISVRRGISFHGLALNVNLSLEPFGWIHPCGLPDVGVTSLARELGETLPMDAVRRVAADRMAAVFGITLVPTTLDGLTRLLDGNIPVEAAGKK